MVAYFTKTVSLTILTYDTAIKTFYGKMVRKGSWRTVISGGRHKNHSAKLFCKGDYLVWDVQLLRIQHTLLSAKMLTW